MKCLQMDSPARDVDRTFKLFSYFRHSIKCLVDDHDVTYITDTITLIQSLDFKHPVGQYIVSVCQSFHQTHRHGVKMLLYMIRALVKAATVLKDQGVPLSCIRKHMWEGIEICSDQADSIKIPIQLEQNKASRVKESVSLQEIVTTECHFPGNPVQERKVLKNGKSESQHPLIYLEMKKKNSETLQITESGNDDIDNEENDDDISWYFESDNFSEVKNEENLPTKFNRLTLNSTATEDEVKITSLRQNSDSDSDFEDCFEGIPVENDVKGRISDNHNSTHNQEAASNKSFCNATFSVAEDLPKTGKFDIPTRQTGDFCEISEDPWRHPNKQILSDQNVGDISEASIRCDFVGKEDKNSSLNDLIENRLKKRKLAVSTKVLNRSRYFKTVTSTVEELSQTASSTVSELNQRASSTAEELNHRASSAVQELNQRALSTVEELTHSASSTVSELNQRASSTVEELNHRASSAVKELNHRASSAVQELNQRASSTAEELNHRASSAVLKLNQTASSTVNELNQRASSTAEELNHRASLAAQKLNQGASSTAEELKCRASSAVQELNQTALLGPGEYRLTESNIKDEDLEFDKDSSERERLREDPKFEESDNMKDLRMSKDHFMYDLRTAEGLQNVLSKKLMKANSQRMSNVLLNSRHFKTLNDCDVQGTASESNHMLSDTMDSEGEIFPCGIQFPDKHCHRLRDADKNMQSQNSEMTKDWYEDSDSRKEKGQDGPLNLSEAVHGLCRGNKTVADLILKAVNHQNEEINIDCGIKFDANRVICLCLSGSLMNPPALVRGLVVNLPVHDMSIICQREIEKLRCVLVNGDLRMSFHHKGYKDTLTAMTVYHPGEYTNRETTEGAWLNQLLHAHSQVPFDVILCKGTIADQVKTLLESQSIICIEGVSYRSLLSLAATHHITMVTYMEELSEDHILKDITLKPLYEDWSLSSSTHHPVLIESCHQILQTVIYNHPSEMGRAKFETDFLRALYVVQSGIQSGFVLPGAGWTEKYCQQKLIEESALCIQTSPYKSAVLQQLAEVMMDFYHTVQNNAKEIHTSLAVYHDDTKMSQNLQNSGTFSVEYEEETENGCTQFIKDLEGNHFFIQSFNDIRNIQNNSKFSYCSKLDDMHSFKKDFQEVECKCRYHHLDNLSSKTAAWKTAYETMATIMSTDTHIITGNDDGETKIESMLLNKVIL